MIRPEPLPPRRPGGLFLLGRIRILVSILLVLATTSAAICPDEREAAFLRGLNAEGRHRLAALQGELHLGRGDACALPPEVTLETGKAHYHLGEFARARDILAQGWLGKEPSRRRHYLESHLLDLARPDLADTVLALVAVPEAKGAMAEEERRLYLSAALHMKGRSEEALAAWPLGEGRSRDHLEAGYKSPGLAAGLAVMPGAGYAYAGQTWDGATALAAAVVFYSAAAWYGTHGSAWRASTAAGLGAVFHVSGIYGSWRAAHETNRRRRLSFLMDLHPHLP